MKILRKIRTIVCTAALWAFMAIAVGISILYSLSHHN